MKIDDTINYLATHSLQLNGTNNVVAGNRSSVGATIGMLWLDIEGTQVSDDFMPFLLCIEAGKLFRIITLSIGHPPPPVT